ncbi:OprD family porin [Pseudomonas sp. NPDC078700]|uniref:OprD family porin n=1 Tax=Pseudomonas sp. NPDC078700 TaxID=3364424 RepID=UPI0037C9F7C2
MPSASRQALTPVNLLSVAVSTALLAPTAHAEFFKDSSGTLTANNIYLNRDFREGTGQNKREEWAQGFIFDIQSGYTEGTVGFGVDALGLLGLKLDSSPDRTGTGLLPTHDDGRAADEYSHLGLTGKVKISATELKVGTLMPELPTLKTNDSRILPQTFEGGLVTSKDISNLTFTGGRIDETKDRDSSNNQDLAINNKNSRFASAATADHLTLAGADYRFTDRITGRYHFAELDDIYRQHFFGLNATQPVGPGTFTADLRLSLSDDHGAANAGKVDNRAFNGMVSYGLNGHKLSLAYQDMSGDTGFAYVDGTDPFLVNFVQINDFANADERSWQARYDYNFSAIGVPGLNFLTRYISGSDAQIAGSNETGDEWERDIEFKYVVQSGPMKDLYVRLRNASFRSDFARNADENRIVIGYSLAIW